MCLVVIEQKSNLKRFRVLNSIFVFKSFGYESNFKTRKGFLSQYKKSFEYKICSFTFGQNGNLEKIINSVHKYLRPLEREFV
jgi:hypothetical protein